MAEELAERGIESKILVIRNQQVMIDRDLAELYGVETKRLNEQVKRNIERFPESFCFQLTSEEFENLKSQFVTSSAVNPLKSQFATLNKSGNQRRKYVKYLPYAFTEQGVAMLSAVLRSETAVQMSVRIMEAFVKMRHFLLSNAQIFQRLDTIERRQIDSDRRIDELFDRMDRYAVDDTQGIFFEGQIFDAYAKFESFIQSAKTEIVLIDGYVDLSVLERLAKKGAGVRVELYTSPKTKLTAQDIQKFNAQYPTLNLHHTTKCTTDF